MTDKIIIKGACEHNLQCLDVVIPREKLVVITGVSGSGKSTLAFDTIYAEGQRRYVESLSAYARQFLEQMDKPDVESIEGLSPAIAIEQKTTSKNPRSTVGTVTEIYDYLRLLFARAGQVHCPECDRAITTQTVEQMVDRILALPEGTRLLVLAPTGARPQGGVPQGIEAAAGRRLCPGAHRRHPLRTGRDPGTGQTETAHHRGGGRPPDPQGRDRHPPGRVAGNRPAPGGGAGAGGKGRRCRGNS